MEGKKTSEYKLTVAAIVLGTVMEGVASALHQLQEVGVEAPWFSVALVLSGVLLQVASLAGYQRTRAVVKSEALRQGTLPVVAQVAEVAAAVAAPVAQAVASANPTVAPPT